MPVATGAGPCFSKAFVEAASALPLRQLLDGPDVVDHRQRQPSLQRKADTTVLFAVLAINYRGKRIFGLAMMQDIFNDCPVQFPGHPALVDQAIHGERPFFSLPEAVPSGI